jgi:hypothetical protein
MQNIENQRKKRKLTKDVDLKEKKKFYAQQITEEGCWIEEESKLPCSVFGYKNRERKIKKERENGRERDLRIVREF